MDPAKGAESGVPGPEGRADRNPKHAPLSPMRLGTLHVGRATPAPGNRYPGDVARVVRVWFRVSPRAIVQNLLVVISALTTTPERFGRLWILDAKFAK